MTDTRNDAELKKRIRKLEKKIEQLKIRLKDKEAELSTINRVLREEVLRKESAETARADSDARLRDFIEKTGCDLPYRAGGPDTVPSGMKEIDEVIGVLFEKNKRYRQELEKKILYNINRIVMPHIDDLLKRVLDVRQGPGFDLPDAGPDAAPSLYSKNLSAAGAYLTRAESRVTDLLRKGHRTREIAEILKLSDKTIETHRKKIRKKLGLRHRKANLRTYLSSIQLPPFENAAGIPGAFSSGDFGDPNGNIGDIDEKHPDHPYRQTKMNSDIRQERNPTSIPPGLNPLTK